MKQFIVDRHTTPNTPTLEQVPTEKIPVYEDMAAAAADLANLAENQIIATHDTGSELSAPVDTVQSGNMHAVTSNAVAVALDGKTIKHKTITGTTNQFGVLYKGNSNLLGTERIINSYLVNSNDDYFCIPGSSPTNGQWLQIRNYLNDVKSNSSVQVEIIYF